MPRAFTRESTHPDVMSEQTHDDCEWLNEEDRQENVLWYWRGGWRRRRAPCATQHDSREVGGDDNADAENRRSDDSSKRGVGLIGILAL